jgi:hypothetical protein
MSWKIALHSKNQIRYAQGDDSRLGEKQELRSEKVSGAESAGPAAPKRRNLMHTLVEKCIVLNNFACLDSQGPLKL